MAAPFGSQAVLGIDPGQRTGCKCVVVDETGKLLANETIYLVQGDSSLERARRQLPTGPGLERCEECDAPIPPARRRAIPGVRLCVACQEAHDQENGFSAYNRRGSKDSQLR